MSHISCIKVDNLEMKLDPVIKSVISMKNIDRFSVTEIRTAYLALVSDEELDSQRIRQLIYDDLHKLVKLGWLIKKTASNGKESRFTKTELFEPDILKMKLKNDSKQIEKSEAGNFQKQLKSDLKNCNVELLKGLGALETYLGLCERYPHESKYFKRKYTAVQEKNHILEGKINALEDILKNT